MNVSMAVLLLHPAAAAAAAGCVVSRYHCHHCRRRHDAVYRVTNCLENLEMSGNNTDVREMSGISLKVREMSGKKILSWKISQKLS